MRKKWADSAGLVLVDDVTRRVFGEACWEIDQMGDEIWVDGNLSFGGLDIKACGKALADATGKTVWDPQGWTAEEVCNLAASARWPTPMSVYDINAKAFLEAAAELRMAISFSW